MTSDGGDQQVDPTINLPFICNFLSSAKSGEGVGDIQHFMDLNPELKINDVDLTLLDCDNLGFTTTMSPDPTAAEEIDNNVTEMCSYLDDFSEQYRGVHGYLSLVVCLLGTVLNLLNIAVLTRKEMNGSPINRFLTGIAVADMLLLVEFIPFCVHMYLWTDRTKEERYSWIWAAVVWFHANFSIVIHTVSIWLTLCLAVWRFIMIRFHTLAPVYCTMFRCHLLIFSAYVVPIFLAVPNFLAIEVQPAYNRTACYEAENVTAEAAEAAALTAAGAEDNHVAVQYITGRSCLAEADDFLLDTINLWLYSLVLKVLPCFVLTIITGFLIKALYKAEERSARLKNGSAYPRRTSAGPGAGATGTTGGGGGGSTGGASFAHTDTPTSRVGSFKQQSNGHGHSGRHSRQNTYTKASAPSSRRKSTDRTTRLLIVILLMFLISEFPPGIMGVLTAVNGFKFFMHCYHPMGDFMDVMALINSAVNFILYCLMSKQFRKTFAELMGISPKLFKRCTDCWPRLVGGLRSGEEEMSQIHQHNGNCTSRNRRSEMAAMLPRNGAAAGITIKIVEPSNNEANGSNGCGGGAASPTHEQEQGGSSDYKSVAAHTEVTEVADEPEAQPLVDTTNV